MRTRRGIHAILAAAVSDDWSILQTAFAARFIVRVRMTQVPELESTNLIRPLSNFSRAH